MKPIAIAIAILLYTAAVSAWGSGQPFAVWRPENMRLFLPIAILLGIVLRFRRSKPKPDDEAGVSAPIPAPQLAVPEPEEPVAEPASEPSAASAAGEKPAPVVETKTVDVKPAAVAAAPSRSGEDDWAAARAIPHQAIPDWESDGAYLELVYSAARGGCVDALAKLGEYAERRQLLVEAYYWYSLADERRKNAYGRTLQRLADTWQTLGFPREPVGFYAELGEQRGSYARSLMRVRLGIDIAAAKRRAEALHPSRC